MPVSAAYACNGKVDGFQILATPVFHFIIGTDDP